VSRRDESLTDRERYRLLVEKAPVGVFEIEGEVITYVNESLERVSGYARDELVGRSPLQLVHQDDREALQRNLEEKARGASTDEPVVCRLLGKSGDVIITEMQPRVIESADVLRIEGTLRDITQETRLRLLHHAVLELGERILGEKDIDRILQLVLDTITTYSGFRRAVLSLYDLSIPVPFEGDVGKILTSGLTAEEDESLRLQPSLPVEERRRAFADDFRMGPAYYIPHDRTPWQTKWGIEGTVSVAGWHQDDFLFIPLRGEGGIIGSISVDDPVDGNVPTPASLEPVASLANFAALAVERVHKLAQARRQKERLHGLWGFGTELSEVGDVETLCDVAARRARDDMDYDYCAVWIVEGEEIVKLGIASKPLFPANEISPRGLRVPIEGGGLTRHALLFREPVIVSDIRSDSRYQGARRSIRSFIGVPIPGRKGPLGVLSVESQTLAAFGEEDIEVLSALASQLSTAMRALHGRESLRRIYALGQRIAAASAVDQVVSSTLDFLIDQFDYEHSEVFLCDEDGDLVLADVRGPYALTGGARAGTLPHGKGILNWVGRNRRSAIVEDVTIDPRYYPVFPQTRSELAVPVLAGQRLLGVLNIESPIPSFFDLEDRQLLEGIANHVAIALSNLASQASLREQAIRDPLTGLYNRHYFNSLIAPELDRSDRYDHPLTLMMVDVDGFRAINNRFGHLKGDQVLGEVAAYLRENVRAADRVIRYGGDEFLILMPETDLEARPVADRLRANMPSVPRRAGIQNVEIGLSIGIYTRLPHDRRPLESILEEVDRRMYADKRGRNVDRADDYRD
jgi:diguanylate cyclase (GGDEF)-like protein/PAS domain S-box-containing protein